MPELRLGQLNYELFLTLLSMKNVSNGKMRAIVQMHGEREEVDRPISNDT
jgi:hypothetical protein